MNRTFKLPESALAIGRGYITSGQEQEALRILGKLASFEELPNDVAEETYAHLADIYFKQRKFKKARRHLQAAIVRNPECARHHYFMATILEEEDSGDVERLLYHYGQAVELAPNEPEYLCDFGLFLLDAGETDEGVRYMERAVECAEDPFKYVRILAFSLVEEGYAEQARRVLIAAMFRDSRDPRLKKLMDELRFREALCTQRRVTLTYSTTEKPVLLPFTPKKQSTQTKATTQTEDEVIIRFDPPEDGRKRQSSQRAKQL